ncbi:MAG: NifB/NifX family molybdenum-iron cluster-binding protein [Desulfitobacteriia bacterium]|jgi:predicted Fe-Mo cluster-binding NifX family protein
MKIAVATEGNSLDSLVAEEFEKCSHLLVVDFEDFSFEAYENNTDQDSFAMRIAKIVVDTDCEAVITGSIEQPAFDTFVIAQVTRYNGAGIPAKEALIKMDNYELDIIRDFKGGDWFLKMHNHSGSCDCGEDH